MSRVDLKPSVPKSPRHNDHKQYLFFQDTLYSLYT